MEDSILNNNASEFVSLIQSSYERGSLSELEKYEKMKLLFNNSINLVNSKLIELRNKDNLLNITNNIDDIIVEVDNVQSFEPRGRFKILLTSDKLLLQGKQSNVLITITNILELIVIPSYMSLKKEGEDYLAIHLIEAVKVNNKDTKYVLLNLLKSFNTTTKSKYSDNHNDFTESTIIMMGLHDVTHLSITRTQTSLFNSIRDSKPYLKCHRSIQEGAIYPLSTGIVFVKPLLIIPSNEIASIKAGRGGSSGNTRYIDVVIETIQDKVYEFTNIDREELPALQAYINYLEEIARKKIKNERKLKKEEVVVINDDNNVVFDLTTTSNPTRMITSVSNHTKQALDLIDNTNDIDDSDDDEDDDDYDPNAASDLEDQSRRHKRKYSSNSDDTGDSSNSDDSGDSENSDSNSDNSIDIQKAKNVSTLTKPSIKNTTNNHTKTTLAKNHTKTKNQVIDLSNNNNNSRKEMNPTKYATNKNAKSDVKSSQHNIIKHNKRDIVDITIDGNDLIVLDHNNNMNNTISITETVPTSMENVAIDSVNNASRQPAVIPITSTTTVATTNITNATTNTTTTNIAIKKITIKDAFLKQTKTTTNISEII